ncbi:MAG: DUF1353 domain-containing protein [Betaproteobacteria bacterium]
MNKPVALLAVVVSIFIVCTTLRSQQRMDPVDFKPFVDGRNWIVREQLTYRIGISQDSLTVPVGFVTDLASIPPALQSFIQQNGPYLLPAVVHDYLYWKQTCTRDQSDQILLLAMIEHAVPEAQRFAIYQAVHFAGMFAWDENARSRKAGLVRILPPDRQKIDANTLWPAYQQELLRQRVSDGPDTVIPAAFCRRADLSTEDALKKP